MARTVAIRNAGDVGDLDDIASPTEKTGSHRTASPRGGIVAAHGTEAFPRCNVVRVLPARSLLYLPSFPDPISPEEEYGEADEDESANNSSCYRSHVGFLGWWRGIRIGYADHIGTTIAALRHQGADGTVATRGTRRRLRLTLDAAPEDGSHRPFHLCARISCRVRSKRRMRIRYLSP